MSFIYFAFWVPKPTMFGVGPNSQLCVLLLSYGKRANSTQLDRVKDSGNKLRNLQSFMSLPDIIGWKILIAWQCKFSSSFKTNFQCWFMNNWSRPCVKIQNVKILLWLLLAYGLQTLLQQDLIFWELSMINKFSKHFWYTWPCRILPEKT